MENRIVNVNLNNLAAMTALNNAAMTRVRLEGERPEDAFTNNPFAMALANSNANNTASNNCCGKLA